MQDFSIFRFILRDLKSEIIDLHYLWKIHDPLLIHPPFSQQIFSDYLSFIDNTLLTLLSIPDENGRLKFIKEIINQENQINIFENQKIIEINTFIKEIFKDLFSDNSGYDITPNFNDPHPKKILSDDFSIKPDGLSNFIELYNVLVSLNLSLRTYDRFRNYINSEKSSIQFSIPSQQKPRQWIPVSNSKDRVHTTKLPKIKIELSHSPLSKNNSLNFIPRICRAPM